jgi:hypothetical protein
MLLLFLFALAVATQVCAIIIPADVMEKIDIILVLIGGRLWYCMSD